MKTLRDNIISYFSKKEKVDQSSTVPKEMCPTCWGQDEWDGQYFKVIKDRHLIPGDDIYENFISKIADKHVKSTHKHENRYICTTCNKAI